MAGEVTGKVCEAATGYALELAGLSQKEYHWGIKPAGMSIKTDFLIGENPNSPDSVILVTHSISAMQSHKKFWRNIGELVELRTLLPNIPSAVNIIYGTAEMKKLSIISSALFDLFIRIVDLDDGIELMNELSLISSQFKNIDKWDTKAWLTRNLSSESRKCLKILGEKILQTNAQKNICALDLWELIKNNQKEYLVEPRETSLKRGSAKLLPFSTEERDMLFNSAKSKKAIPGKPPKLAVDLDIVGGLEKRFVVDGDIQRFAYDFSIDDLHYIIESTPLRDLNRIAIEPLHAVGNLDIYRDFVLDNWKSLTTVEGMLLALNKCHADPSNLTTLLYPVNHVWLVDYIITVAKSRRGGHNDYGHSQLAKESGLEEGISASGYRVFADWVNRRERGFLPEESKEKIAKALTKEIQAIDSKILTQISHNLKEKYIRTFFQIKLLTYENFDPLLYLIKRILKKEKIVFEELSRFPSAFGEYARVKGATSKLLLANGANGIYWQSAHGSGNTNHKKKELSGRAASIKFTYNPSSGAFLQKLNIRKLILIIDGSWQKRDLEILHKAGWDCILHITDLNQLSSNLI